MVEDNPSPNMLNGRMHENHRGRADAPDVMRSLSYRKLQRVKHPAFGLDRTSHMMKMWPP
jgi:hypothetical protein